MSEINSIIALYGETAVFDAENLSSMIEENSRKFKAEKKPLVFSIFGGEKIENCLISLKKTDAAVYGDVYRSGLLFRFSLYAIIITCGNVRMPLTRPRSMCRRSSGC